MERGGPHPFSPASLVWWCTVALMCRREPNVDTNILQLLHKLSCETELAFIIISSRDQGPVEAELRPLSACK